MGGFFLWVNILCFDFKGNYNNIFFLQILNWWLKTKQFFKVYFLPIGWKLKILLKITPQ